MFVDFNVNMIIQILNPRNAAIVLIGSLIRCYLNDSVILQELYFPPSTVTFDPGMCYNLLCQSGASCVQTLAHDGTSCGNSKVREIYRRDR